MFFAVARGEVRDKLTAWDIREMRLRYGGDTAPAPAPTPPGAPTPGCQSHIP
jgi:hypothetical protein